MPTTGPQLRKERRRSEVTVTALAARMKTSRQTIHGWERAAVVPGDFAAAYMAALRDVTEASSAEDVA